MKTAFGILFASLWGLVSAAALELCITYEEPREVSAVLASLKEGGSKSSLGIFGKGGAKAEDGRFEGKDVLLVTLPQEGRKVAVSEVEEIKGVIKPYGFIRFDHVERVSRIDCFAGDPEMVIYLHADSGIRKITIRRDRLHLVETVAKDEVPEMKAPLLLSFPKGAKMPLIR